MHRHQSRFDERQKHGSGHKPTQAFWGTATNRSETAASHIRWVSPTCQSPSLSAWGPPHAGHHEMGAHQRSHESCSGLFASPASHPANYNYSFFAELSQAMKEEDTQVRTMLLSPACFRAAAHRLRTGPTSWHHTHPGFFLHENATIGVCTGPPHGASCRTVSEESLGLPR